MPVYKVEKQLPKAIESIKAQTFSDWEAILIDDGSPDNCGKICDEAAKSDSRFKVIHQQNGGVSSARNAGLDVAQGEYIHFFDSDDTIEDNLAEELIAIADKNNADLVYFGFYQDIVDENGSVISSVVKLPPITGVEKDEPIKRLYNKIATYYLLTLKLVKRSLIEKGHCRFPKKSIGEDAMFFVSIYNQDPKCVVSVDKAYYHYRMRAGSASVSFHEDRLTDNFYLTKANADLVKKWGLLEDKEYLDTLKYCALRDLQLGIKNISYSKKSFSEQAKILKSMFKDKRLKTVVKDVPLSRVNGRNDKIKLLFLKLHLYSGAILLSNLNK